MDCCAWVVDYIWGIVEYWSALILEELRSACKVFAELPYINFFASSLVSCGSFALSWLPNDNVAKAQPPGLRGTTIGRA